MKTNKIYCVFCGTENKSDDDKCLSCHKKLNPKENLFVDYLKNHIRDDIKGQVEDKLSSIIIAYLKSHLYGLILTLSIVITSTSIIISSLNEKTDYEEVINPPAEKEVYDTSGLEPREVALKYMELLSNDKATLASSMISKEEWPSNNLSIQGNANFFANNFDFSKLIPTREVPNPFQLENVETHTVIFEYTYCQEQICNDTTNNIEFVFIVEMVKENNKWLVFNDSIDFDTIASGDEYYALMDVLRANNFNISIFIEYYYQ